MKNTIKLFCCFILTSSIILTKGYCWGAWGHTHINRAAILSLPAEMRTFFYNHADFITEGAVVPDLRRGVLNDKTEGYKHFIDLEDFKVNSVDDLPRTPKDALNKYDSAFLQKGGILPWHIQIMMEKLTQAFKKRNKSEILFIAAELGHYVADAHVPLHTSSNHDGQLTNQKGIHAFWESKLPETFGNTFNFNGGEARFINNTTEQIFSIIKTSHQLVDILLLTEKQVHQSFPANELYMKDSSGQIIKMYNQPVYSNAYAAKYYQSLHGMIDHQMNSSIADLSSLWFTAWVNAGKPELTSLDDPSITKANRKNFKKEYKNYKKGISTKLKTDRG
ncbi:hypothetical protein BH09BAC2_BH09BAC2_23590 [soil metagenome]